MPQHFSGNLEGATHQRTRKINMLPCFLFSGGTLLSLEVRAQRAYVKPRRFAPFQRGACGAPSEAKPPLKGPLFGARVRRLWAVRSDRRR